MPLEYAPHGLVGLLVPPANTTVEAEAAVLLPPGIGWLAARLAGDVNASVATRLTQYLEALDGTLGQLNNAPVGAWALAVTGASYFCGPAREDALVAALEARLGVPFITAAHAVGAALRALGARRIALVSPYPGDVTAASVAYWTARGFGVTAVAKVVAPEGAFHAIYAMGSAEAVAAMRTLDTTGAEAVVLLGTGMPSLPAIAAHPTLGGVPVLSSMLALGWRVTEALLHHAGPRPGTLRACIAGEGWRDRLATRRPGTPVA